MKNGNLKSLLPLWENLASHHRYAPYVEDTDIKVFRKRAESEGVTFLAKTLPGIGKALDRYFATYAFDPYFGCEHGEFVCPPGFAQWGQSVKLTHAEGNIYPFVNVPLFLHKAVVAAIEGDSVAVDCVRQLSYMFYKLEVDYDSETVSAFLNQFIEVDKDCAITLHSYLAEGSIDGISVNVRSNASKIVELMRREIERILCNSDPLDITPCHGTGATACRTVNYEKHYKWRYYPQLDNVYSYSDYFYYSPTHLVDRVDELQNVEESEPMARVCLVPKDSRGPRIISCEPAALMFVQQGIMRKLYDVLETHPLTSGFLNFTDQSINQRLACSSSSDGKYATIDLKDASDRVSLDLVRLVFPPNWVEALEACRSKSTLLPDGRVVELNKFAPMGSSCCFPVEALVFWTCARAAVRILSGYLQAPEVYVYGDDIIVPTNHLESTIQGLTLVGLIVNREKSYGRGPFRESCGGDYHNSYDVSPVRVKRFLEPSSTNLIAWADLCNEIIAKFGWQDRAISSIVSHVEECLGYCFPRTQLEIPLTLRVLPGSSNDVLFKRRWSKDLQRYEYRVLALSIKELRRQPPDWEELLRKELVRRRETSKTPDLYSRWVEHPEREMNPGVYADTHSVRSKWVWTWLGEPRP